MRYLFIGDIESAIGFRMAGVGSVIVSNSVDCQEALQEALKSKGIAVILITDKAAELVRDEVDRYIFSSNLPLVCEIPSITGKSSDHVTISEIANRVIGVKI